MTYLESVATPAQKSPPHPVGMDGAMSQAEQDVSHQSFTARDTFGSDPLEWKLLRIASGSQAF